MKVFGAILGGLVTATIILSLLAVSSQEVLRNSGSSFSHTTIVMDHKVSNASGVSTNPKAHLRPYPIPVNEVEIGPGVRTYFYAHQIPEEQELEGLQVPVPRDCRIINTKGNCVWCSLELAGRYQGMTELHNITKNVRDGGDPRCQGGSSPSPVRSFLEDENIKYEMITNGDKNFLIKYCKGQRRPVCFDVPGHMLNLVHYDPDTKLVKVIDNADHSLSVQTWSWEKFHSRWGGWAYVVFGEPDLLPYKYNTWRLIPIIGGEDKYHEDFLPIPLPN